MIRSVAKIVLRSKIRHDNNTRTAAFLPWEKIESLALIISNRDHVNKSQTDKFIADTGKYVEVFYIEPDAKTPSFHDWHCFCTRDKSFLNLPRKHLAEKLRARAFDAVINTCPETELFSTWIASTLRAPLKCGSIGRFHDVDLIISKKGTDTLTGYLYEVMRYLRMIRTA